MKIAAFALALLLAACLLCGCAGAPVRRDALIYDCFDTVVTVSGWYSDEAAWNAELALIEADIRRYDALFDIYDACDMPNLKTVNDSAGIAPVEVDGAIIALLSFGISAYELTGGAVNIAMGAVLSIWHDCRTAETPYLPDYGALASASLHCDISSIVIDEAASTVYISDPLTSIDVGAVAKGYAAELTANSCRERGAGSIIINMGGNTVAVGSKPDGSPFTIAVQNPFQADGEPSATIELADASAVTSGGYERYFEIDGKSYNHIIDPKTLYPADVHASVTIVCDDSGLADALSTALFVLTVDEGKLLLESSSLLKGSGASAVWVERDGTVIR